MDILELRQQKQYLIGLYKMYGDKEIRKEIRALDKQIIKALDKINKV